MKTAHLGMGMQGLWLDHFHPYLLVLAVYFEHTARQPQDALVIVRKALDELHLAKELGTMGPGLYCQLKAQFEHRLARLELKSGQTMLDLEQTEPLSEE